MMTWTGRDLGPKKKRTDLGLFFWGLLAAAMGFVNMDYGKDLNAFVFGMLALVLILLGACVRRS